MVAFKFNVLWPVIDTSFYDAKLNSFINYLCQFVDTSKMMHFVPFVYLKQ